MKRASGVPIGSVAGAWRAAFLWVRLRFAVLVIVAIALGGIGASSASAYDVVWLNNSTSVPFTEGSFCVLVGAVSCAEFPAWQEGAVLAAGQSNPGISLVLQVTGVTPSAFKDTWFPPSGISGHFEFDAVDPPIGPAFVQCSGDVPGFDCAVADKLYAYFEQIGSSSPEGLIGSPSPQRNGSSSPVEARFWSGLAPVSHGGIALVPVASYSTRRRGTVRERVILRSGSGRVLGRGKKTIRFGTRASIEVRLARGVSRTVASGSSIDVRASVTHADGTVGKGQTTNALVLTRLTPALRPLLHLPAG